MKSKKVRRKGQGEWPLPTQLRVGDTGEALNTPDNEHHTRVREAIQGMTPQQVALFAALLVNGGNVTRAARVVGMNESYARRLVSTHGVFRESVRQFGAGMATCMQEWLDLVPQAKATMLRLLHDPDGKVRYLAAKDILDRAEGKPISRMEMTVRESKPVLSEGEVQLAFALMQRRGISYAQAVDLIRGNPEEAAAWIEANRVAVHAGALPPGKVEDAVVIPIPEVDAWQDAAREEEQTHEDAPGRTQKSSRGKGRGKR